MDEFKGTPGPWQVVDTYQEYTDESGIIIWNGDEQASGPVCDMGEMGDMNYGEALANANLIAAAPDLLGALQLLIHYHMCEQEGMSSGQPSATEWYAAVDRASAAIGKAFGKETTNG